MTIAPIRHSVSFRLRLIDVRWFLLRLCVTGIAPLLLQNADSFHAVVARAAVAHLPVGRDVGCRRQHPEQSRMAGATVWIFRIHMARVAEDAQAGTGRSHL